MGWAIAIHGGAGVDPSLPISRQQQAEQVLRRCLQLGISALQASFPAIDVAELVVRELEVDPTFNAGRGSALTTEDTVEMEASIMDGARKKCGAVSGISTVTNAISLARLVMEKTPHVYLAFAGAEEFARKQGIKTVDTSYFITEENKLRLEQAKKANSIQFDYRLPEPELPTENGAKLPEQSRENGESKKKQYEKGLASPRHLHGTEKGNENGVLKPHVHGVITAEKPAENGVQKTKENGVLQEMKMNGIPISIYEPETVGCVVVDSQGRCAAATSTGGLLNKMTGRIGDSPIIGAGTYANHLCAVSATGEGEAIIRATAARDVAALMEYKGLSVNEAVNYVINERLEAGKGGLIAVSSGGQVAMGFNTAGMFRACATAEGFYQVGTWD